MPPLMVERRRGSPGVAGTRRKRCLIRVLQDWREVGQCFLELQRAGLPAHETVQKNWDHLLLSQLVAPLPRDARVVDLGCGAGYTMSFLSALGFADICGVELHL